MVLMMRLRSGDLLEGDVAICGETIVGNAHFGGRLIDELVSGVRRPLRHSLGEALPC